MPVMTELPGRKRCVTQSVDWAGIKPVVRWVRLDPMAEPIMVRTPGTWHAACEIANCVCKITRKEE